MIVFFSSGNRFEDESIEMLQSVAFLLAFSKTSDESIRFSTGFEFLVGIYPCNFYASFHNSSWERLKLYWLVFLLGFIEFFFAVSFYTGRGTMKRFFLSIPFSCASVAADVWEICVANWRRKQVSFFRAVEREKAALDSPRIASQNVSFLLKRFYLPSIPRPYRRILLRYASAPALGFFPIDRALRAGLTKHGNDIFPFFLFFLFEEPQYALHQSAVKAGLFISSGGT